MSTTTTTGSPYAVRTYADTLRDRADRHRQHAARLRAEADALIDAAIAVERRADWLDAEEVG